MKTTNRKYTYKIHALVAGVTACGMHNQLPNFKATESWDEVTCGSCMKVHAGFRRYIGNVVGKDSPYYIGEPVGDVWREVQS